jgi:hypothetical protein
MEEHLIEIFLDEASQLEMLVANLYLIFEKLFSFLKNCSQRMNYFGTN